VIPVTITEGVPMVTPAYPQQKLWLESLNHFGMESDGLRPIIDRETKFAVPVESQFFNESLPLAGVFELVKTDEEEVKLLPVSKLQRLHTLFYHTYRNFLIGPMGLMEWHFNTTASFVNKIELFQLQRPTTHFTAHELTSLILSTISQESCRMAK
ncbi:MAG TPA: aldolase, partial [Bacillus bacterium]|nr:aldolase [Bacillus sp. (in: firmicutes)]